MPSASAARDRGKNMGIAEVVPMQLLTPPTGIKVDPGIARHRFTASTQRSPPDSLPSRFHVNLNMSRQRPLRGACSCGRNLYAIVVPTHASEQAQVYFDDSSESSRLSSSRIP